MPKVHVPAEGRGSGFNWITVCGRSIKTRTGDVRPIQQEARAIASVTKIEDPSYGKYCIQCLNRLRQVI